MVPGINFSGDHRRTRSECVKAFEFMDKERLGAP